MRHGIVAGVLALALAGCGGGSDGPLQLQSVDDYQEFFWDYCLPFAQTLTDLAESENQGLRAAGDPIACPGGGVVVYNATTGVATLDACEGVGAVVDGTLDFTLLETQQADISGGSLSITGAYEGTATINSGFMAWELPVADATTYWELHMTLDGSPVCLWSGAETGPCPQAR